MLTECCSRNWPARVRSFGAFLVTVLIFGVGQAIAQPSDLAKATALRQKVVELFTAGRFNDAIVLADEALAIRERALAPEDPAIAESLTDLADLYSAAGHDTEAEPYYLKGLTIQEKALGPEHLDLATTLDHLAQAYSRQRRYSDAELLFERSLTILEKRLGPEHAEVAKTLNRLAVVQLYQGRYSDAELLLKRALAIDEKTLGPEHPAVALVLQNLANLYRGQGPKAEAEACYRRALAIVEKTHGPESVSVNLLLGLADVYGSENRYADAEPLYQRVIAIQEKAPDSESQALATTLRRLADLYRYQSRPTDAEPLYKRSLTIYEHTVGPDNPDVALVLNSLGLIYDEQSRPAEAEPLYKRAIAIREKTLGAEDPDLAPPLSNLADLYIEQGRYAEAEPLYKRSLVLFEKAQGPDGPEVANRLNNLAVLYVRVGRYPEAEPIYKRALAIAERLHGPEHPDVAETLNNLATLYRAQGRYTEAEALFKRSLAIIEKTLGPETTEFASSLNNLAELYSDEDRYGEAEPLFVRSLAIFEKLPGGSDTRSFANVLNNLEGVYRGQGHSSRAVPLAKRSLAILEKALGPEHPDVATFLNNLANLYHSLHQYDEAQPLYERALAIQEKMLGPDNPAVATTLNNLAGLYQEQNRYAEAEPLYERSLAIREKVFGPEHPNVAASLGNLANLYQKQHRIPEALKLLRRGMTILSRQVGGGSLEQSDTANAVQRGNRGYFIETADLIYTNSEPTAAAESFRVGQLANASVTAQAVNNMTARFATGSDALAAIVRERQDLADQWHALDKAIVTAASRPPGKRNPAAEDAQRKELAEAGDKINALDARIARDFPQYTELSNPKPVELADIQAILAPNEAMLAYLVGIDASWLWVVRCDSAGFFRLDADSKTLSAEVAKLRQRLDPALNPDFTPFDAKRSYALYKTILAPAAKLLDRAQAILVVPDGALASLPFGVLVTEEPKDNPDAPADHRDVHWLARDYAVTVLPSVGTLRALRQFVSKTKAQAPFLGIGNPRLDGPVGQASGIPENQLFRGSLADVDAVRQLPPLPETADELRALAHDMGATENDLLLGERATEPELRATPLDHYQVIEFATHGLMSGDLKGLAEPALVLTPPKQASPADDGLLTASKIATLKLDADWVVLSACNTAASDGTPNAGGLSGLAKAFFYAGARSLLVSHWSVPSQATVKLIIGTFDALQKGPGIGRAEALRRAEMAMLDPANPTEFAHPMMWAPFVLAGEGGTGR